MMNKRNCTFLLQGIESIQMENVQIELQVMDIGRLLELTKKSNPVRELQLGIRRHLFSIEEKLQVVTRPIGSCTNIKLSILL